MYSNLEVHMWVWLHVHERVLTSWSTEGIRDIGHWPLKSNFCAYLKCIVSTVSWCRFASIQFSDRFLKPCILSIHGFQAWVSNPDVCMQPSSKPCPNDYSSSSQGSLCDLAVWCYCPIPTKYACVIMYAVYSSMSGFDRIKRHSRML